MERCYITLEQYCVSSPDYELLSPFSSERSIKKFYYGSFLGILKCSYQATEMNLVAYDSRESNT